MRLLFVSPTCPLPANNGSKLRIWALLRCLAEEGHQVDLLTFAHPDEIDGSYARLKQICHEVAAVPLALPRLSGTTNYRSRVWALLRSRPYGVARFESKGMKALLSAWLRSRNFDAVLCETPYALINLPNALPAPLFLDNQNLEYLLLQRYLSYERNPAKRAYAWLECEKVRRWEECSFSRADLLAVCSEQDRALVRKLVPARRVVVLPNVVDVDRYPLLSDAGGWTLLYMGGMDWYPNQDAVAFFLTEIWPELRRRLPQAKFVVAGRAPHDGFLERFGKLPGVRFAGNVPDMSVEIAKATVCVVPLRIGSGTRLKILEAAAMGKAVVSTRIGAEGLEFVQGEEIMLADQPEEFTAALAELLGDARRRCGIGHAARRRLEQQYSIPALRTAIRDALAHLGQQHAQTCTKAVSSV